MVANDSLLQDGEFSLRLGDASPLREFGQSCTQVTTGAASGRCFSLVSQRSPDVNALVERTEERLEVRRHYSDDCASDTVDELAGLSTIEGSRLRSFCQSS